MSAQKTSVLGKGLGALLPGAGLSAAAAYAAANSIETHQTPTANSDRHMGISMIAPGDIEVNPFQPRREFAESAIQELAESIKVNGIIQPLVVRKTNTGYQLIAGERRLRAAKAAGLKQVPIVIRKSTDKESLEVALIENIQRENLNCVDEALAYFQLVQEFSLSQEEVAQRVGKDRATVSNFIRLLRLPEAIIDDLKKGVLTFGHGKALLSLEENDLRMKVRFEIIDRNLSVRETEKLVQKTKENPSVLKAEESKGKSLPPTPVAQRLNQISQDLTRKWSTKVELQGNDKKGKIVLHFHTREELERLLTRL